MGWHSSGFCYLSLILVFISPMPLLFVRILLEYIVIYPLIRCFRYIYYFFNFACLHINSWKSNAKDDLIS